jgi:hypothetical protein
MKRLPTIMSIPVDPAQLLAGVHDLARVLDLPCLIDRYASKGGFSQEETHRPVSDTRTGVPGGVSKRKIKQQEEA